MYSYELHQIISNRFLVLWPLLVLNSLPLLDKWRPPGQVQTFDSGWLYFSALGHTAAPHTIQSHNSPSYWGHWFFFFFMVALWCSLSFVFNSSFHPLAVVFIVLKLSNLLSPCRLSPGMRCSDWNCSTLHIGETPFLLGQKVEKNLHWIKLNLRAYIHQISLKYAAWAHGILNRDFFFLFFIPYNTEWILRSF